MSQLGSSWHAEPLVVAGLALALALFAQAFVRLRRRGRTDHAGAGRAVLFLVGLAGAGLALLSPLDAVADEYLLSAHMLQHVLIGDIAPLLILTSLRGPLTFFLLPAPALRKLAGVRALRALASFLLRPWISFGVWTVAILGWHVPAAYDFALAHQTAHDLEHLSFVFVGVLAWTQIIDPARHGRLSHGGRITFAVGLLAIGHVSHDALLAGTPLYAPYVHQGERLFGLSPLADQHLAAYLMLGEQTLVLGTAIAVLWILRRREANRAPAGRSELATG